MSASKSASKTTPTRKIPLRLVKLRKELQQRNAEFDAMSPAQKRVAIAKDVIQQLDLERFTARQGVYISLPNGTQFTNPATKKGYSSKDSVQETLCSLKDTTTCHVCAKGALFLSSIRVGNKLAVGDCRMSADQAREQALGSPSLKMDSFLHRYFGMSTANKIEQVFECWSSHRCEGRWPGQLALRTELVNQWSARFPESEDRLRAICRNIISNGGTFTPEKIPAKERPRRKSRK